MHARAISSPISRPPQARWQLLPDLPKCSRWIISPSRSRFACRSTSSNDDALLRQQAKLLDQLFYSASSSEEPGSDGADDPARAALLSLPGVIPDLPLWRVQWSVLPSYQEVLHVHVPHYVDLFSRLFSQKRPWRFGHLYLPGGSASLGQENYALQYGSNAPLVGTLMEIVQVVRFADGRLLILAVGVGRFKVLNTIQTIPASRADVMLLPDEEELFAASDSSTKALEHLTKDENELSVTRAMHAMDAAAQHAAAASAQSWWEYELMHCRVHEKLAVIDSSDNETAAMQFGRRLVNIGSNEIMELPWAADDFNKNYFSSMQSIGSSSHYDMNSDGEEEESEASLFEMNLKANAAAIEAAEEMIKRLLLQQQGEGKEDSKEGRKEESSLLWQELETFLRSRYSAINSLKERGINPIASSGAGGRVASSSSSSSLETNNDDEEKDNERKESTSKTSASIDMVNDFLVECVRLEHHVWREIDAVRSLAEKIAGRATPLADGLRCLRPPLSDIISSTGLEFYKQQEEIDNTDKGNTQYGGKEGAHLGYPALRRVQRLSFALASSLGDVSASEGRQAWLEVHSIAGRLRLGLSALRRHRDVLAAVVAVRNLRDTGIRDDGVGGDDGEGDGGENDDLEDRLM